MDELQLKLERANRLAEISQRVGFAVWQLQELESASAQCFVLLAQATKGMGLEAGNNLLEKASKKTFGNTVRRMTKANLLSATLGTRFLNLLAERNWLVHRC